MREEKRSILWPKGKDEANHRSLQMCNDVETPSFQEAVVGQKWRRKNRCYTFCAAFFPSSLLPSHFWICPAQRKRPTANHTAESGLGGSALRRRGERKGGRGGGTWKGGKAAARQCGEGGRSQKSNKKKRKTWRILPTSLMEPGTTAAGGWIERV